MKIKVITVAQASTIERAAAELSKGLKFSKRMNIVTNLISGMCRDCAGALVESQTIKCGDLIWFIDDRFKPLDGQIRSAHVKNAMPSIVIDTNNHHIRNMDIVAVVR